MEGFLIRNSNCLIDVRLFRFSVSSCLSFHNLCFSVIFLSVSVKSVFLSPFFITVPWRILFRLCFPSHHCPHEILIPQIMLYILFMYWLIYPFFICKESKIFLDFQEPVFVHLGMISCLLRMNDPVCQIYWHKIVHNIPILSFSWV